MDIVEDIPIICGVATIEDRQSSLETTVKSILPQVDKLYVYQNGFKKLPSFLTDDKITVLSSLDTGIDMGDAGKFFTVAQHRKCYYFSIDDDLTYPSDYVKNTVDYLKQNNNEIVVSYHGRTFTNTATNYYNQPVKSYRCLDDVYIFDEIQYPGTGVTAFYTEYFKLTFEIFTSANMADIFVGNEILKNKKKCYVLPHSAGWIKHNTNLNINNCIYNRYLHSNKVNELFNQRLKYTNAPIPNKPSQTET